VVFLAPECGLEDARGRKLSSLSSRWAVEDVVFLLGDASVTFRSEPGRSMQIRIAVRLSGIAEEIDNGNISIENPDRPTDYDYGIMEGGGQ